MGGYYCMENEYLEWFENNPFLSYKNGKILFTESSMKSFVKSFKTKIEKKYNICINSDKELEILFFNLFIKGTSKERGIIGNYSISLSKKDIFSVVLAIASLTDVFISGINVHSAVISGGGLLYALSSLINKLSKDELQIIGVIALLQQKSSENITSETIANNFNEYSADYISDILHSLLKKDAIKWDGITTSEITVKKWP
jgi:hypothetical protein